jgi:ribosomal protein S1
MALRFVSEFGSKAGRRTNRHYQLGDRVHVQVVRVDLQRRQLDLRVSRPESAKKQGFAKR